MSARRRSTGGRGGVGAGRSLTAAPVESRGWPSPWLLALPLVLIALAFVLEAVTPPRFTYSPLLIAAVVLAALIYRPVVTVAAGVFSLVLFTALHLLAHNLGAPENTSAVVTLVVMAGLAVLLAVLRERTARELTEVRAVAEAVQLALLRPLPVRMGHVRLAGFYRAADDAALIGGDLYSVRPSPHGVRVLVGDVRGKGLGATETVSTVTSAFREAAATSGTLAEAAEQVERAMLLEREAVEAGASRVPEAASGGAEGELFATAVLVEFPEPGADEGAGAEGDAGGSLVRVLDRGHPPLLLVGPRGVRPLEAEYGLPLGLGDLAPGGPETRSFPVRAGELIVAYSDGVTEARGRDGSFYPLRRRLAERYVHGPPANPGADGGSATGTEAGAPDPAEVAAFVHRDVTAWAPALSDDVVVVVMQPDGGGRPAP